MKEFLKSVISTGNYVLSEMEERIQKMYVLGKITEEDMTELLGLAAEKANDALQVDVMGRLVALEHRIQALETKDIPVWESGYTTNKGEVVKFDYDNDGVLDLLRYDGGRSYTSLRPGKIDGWHVVDSEGNILGVFYNGEFTSEGASEQLQ